MNDRQLRMIKKAFMPLTDQAMAAQGAPMPPQGGAPMPPPGAMPPAGAPMPPVDPNTGMPMDPNMMAAQGTPMPPQGGMPPVDPATGMPIDPNTGMPMDPNMMAAQGAPMPPQGGAPVSTGDMVIDMLLEMGAMIVDPTGQPVPPELIAQMVQEMNAQTGGMSQGGAPEGAPAGDPNGDAVLETMAQVDKNISVLLDKVDSIRNLIDSERGEGSNKDNKEESSSNEIDPELLAYLEEQAAMNAGAPEDISQEGSPMPPQGAIPMQDPYAGIDPQQAEQLSLMQAMGGR